MPILDLGASKSAWIVDLRPFLWNAGRSWATLFRELLQLRTEIVFSFFKCVRTLFNIVGWAIYPLEVQNIGIFIAGLLVSFAIWQYRNLKNRLAFLERETRMKKRQLDFLKHQAGRRLQMSVLIGISGCFMLCGLYLSPQIRPSLWTLSWSVVIFLLTWIILLAAADFVAIKLHFYQKKEKNRIERLRFEYEMKKATETRRKHRPSQNATSSEHKKDVSQNNDSEKGAQKNANMNANNERSERK